MLLLLAAPHGYAAPRAYPVSIPVDVSFEAVVAAEPYPAMKYPVPIVGWKNHPEEVGVTPNGALVFPRPDATRGLYVAPFLSVDGGELRALPLDKADRALVEGYMPGILSAWHVDGVTVKQKVFGTLLRGEEVRTGREPLVAMNRWTLANPSGKTRTVDLWLNLGAAEPGATMDAPPPAYRRALRYEPPAVLEPDGRAAAVLLSPGTDASFLAWSPPSDGKRRQTVLNAEEKTTEGARFELPVHREGDAVSVNGWTSPRGLDLYFESSRRHVAGTVLEVAVEAPGGVTRLGYWGMDGLRATVPAEPPYIAPGRHSAPLSWSRLKEALPQGESRIVLTGLYPAPDGPRPVMRWEPVVLAVEPGEKPVFLAPGPGNPRENSLRMRVTLAPGASQDIDLAVPYYPVAGADAEAVSRLNWGTRFDAFKGFWKRELNRNARFDIPEKRIRDASRAALAYNLLLTDAQPDTGRLLFHPDPTAYEAVWAGDGGVIAEAFDRLGYHDQSARGLDYFLSIQGTRKPQADVSDHRGFFNGDSPNWWISENGFVLWAMAQHYRLTGDRPWLRRVAPAMLESAAWIQRQRARTKVMDGGEKPRSYGLLPKGEPYDLRVWDNWYWTDTYSYMGLRGAAEALRDIGRTEDAERLTREAADYRACILDSVRRSINREVTPPFVPSSPFRNAAPTQEALDAEWYSLANPVYMVEAGLFPATDPQALWTETWLERFGLITGLPSFGPEVVDPHYVYNQALAQLLRGDTEKFLWSFYSMFAWGQSRSTYATVETVNIVRGENGTAWDANRQPHMHSNARVLDMVRIALLMEDGPRLHLLAGTPTGWLAPGRTIGIHDAPTEFGRIDVLARSVAGRREVRFQISPPERGGADLVLHVRPPERYGAIRWVTVDGKPWAEFSGRVVRLGKRTGATRVVCGF